MAETDSRPSPILSCFSGGVSNVLQCFNLNILDICYLLFIFVICIQIRRKIAEGHKYTSKKCLIFYLIVVDLILQFSISTISQNKYLFQTEQNLRNLVYVAVFYYFMYKVSRISSKRHIIMRKVYLMTGVVIILILLSYFITIIELINNPTRLDQCKIQTDKVSKIIGAIVSLAMVYYCYRLQNKIDSKTQDYFFEQDLPNLKIKEFQTTENQKEDLWVFILVYFCSQFMTMFLEIYFFVKVDDITCTYAVPCQIIPCINVSAGTTLGLELLLRFIFKVIIVFLPFVAIVRLFWSSPLAFVQNDDLDASFFNMEENNTTYFNKMGYVTEERKKAGILVNMLNRSEYESDPNSSINQGNNQLRSFKTKKGGEERKSQERKSQE